jgi:predicted permease
MLNDCRVAIRTLLRSPGFTIVALLSLALGIGANTAIFSLLDQALLRSLPVSDPNRLVVFDAPGPDPGWTSSDNNQTVFSVPMYQDLRDRSTVFAGIIARSGAAVSVMNGGETDIASAEIVSGNFFDVLGVRPFLGRFFTPAEDKAPGAAPVVVLAHAYWVRRFGGDRSIVGKTIRVNNHPMTVIGVSAAGFRGVMPGQEAEIFAPIAMKLEISPSWPATGFTDRRVHWLNLFARLAPGMDARRAAAATQPVYHSILEEELVQMKSKSPRFRTEFLGKRLGLLPAAQGINQLGRSWGRPLTVLMALVGLVLLIVCANVANLLIARAAGRRREIAIRIAIGATRWGLMRQLLTESVILSIAGGLLGILVSGWTVALLLKMLPEDSAGSFLGASSFLDGRVLAFNLILSLSAGVLFGLAPALEAGRSAISQNLKDQSGSTTASGGQAGFRRILVIAQVALSLLLLVACGLFSRSLANLMTHNPGFHVENLVTFSVSPQLVGYSPERASGFVKDLLQRVNALPGVTRASAGSMGAFTDSDRSSNVTVEGYTAREEENMNVNRDSIAPGYISTLGIPLLVGREFRDSDTKGAPKVVIVNEAFARYFFQGRNPVGRHMTFGGGDVKLDTEIVGLVRDIQSQNLRGKIPRFAYSPCAQDPDCAGYVHVYARTSRDPESLFPALRAAVSQIDAGVPVRGMETMRVQINDTVYTDRLVAALSLAFGVWATLLAAIGLYGLIAYNVTRRTSEIGIRIALGAERFNVLRLVMREVMVLSIAGTAVGIPIALALSRYVESQLFGLNARDPLVFIAATVALLAVAFAAGYFPARRATKIDPIRALRYE